MASIPASDNTSKGSGDEVGGSGNFATRNAAVHYIREGFAVITYPAGQKNPVGRDWQHRPLTREQAMALTDDVNLGLLLGSASGGLYDVDCDVAQARKAWSRWGLRTDLVHGRPHNPSSHYWYICVDEPDHRRAAWSFSEPNTAGDNGEEPQMYVELRGGNAESAAQTMVPPSTHPDGEQLAWEKNGKPTIVTYAELYRRAQLTAAATLVARYWPAKGSRDEAAMALAGGLVRGTDWTDDEIDEFTEMVAWLAGDEEHNDRQKAAPTREEVEVGREATGWPTLKKVLRNGDAVVKTLMQWLDIRPSGKTKDGRVIVHTRDGIAKMEQAVLGELAKANDPSLGEPRVYVRNGQLVRIRYDEEERQVVSSLNKAALTSDVDTLVQFRSAYKDGTTHPIMPPDEVVNAVLVARRYALPPLAGISEVPLLRPDGSVLCTPGYDVATRMLYRPVMGAAAVPPVPDSPTNADVQQAVKLIMDAIGDFPFATEADQANAFAALLSPVLRAALGRALHPMPLFDAPSVGTGKTLLAKTISMITVGKYAGVPTPTEEPEWAKVITSALLAARPLVVFDNATGRVDSASLALVLTSPTFAPRLLGRNEMPDLLNGAVWMMTANNLSLSRDIARRTYRVRLDAKTAKPWKRGSGTFQHPNLSAWVEQERHRLLHAVLVLARAWYARGKPAPATVPQMGSYEEWAATIAGILGVAGINGFLANQDELFDAADNATDEWVPFLTVWFRTWADKPKTTGDIYDTVRDRDGENIGTFVLNDDLLHALPGNLGDAVYKSGTFTRKLGHMLRAQVGTRYGPDELHVERGPEDEHLHQGTWRVVKG